MSTSSVRVRLPGMESVIACVSGYHGTQRFNLIKLIDHAGGSHVGSMSPSVTHLFCWEFQGRKYKIAKKLKIIIVNHRWIEDCIRQGRRVPERSFTALCGKEVGSLLMEVPAVPDSVSNQSSAGNGRHVIDIDSEDDAAAVSLDTILLKENMFPDVERRTEGSKLKRGLVKNTTSQIHSSRATHDNETPVSCYYNENMFPKVEKRRQGSKLKRRLVKKTTTQSHSSGATYDDETSVSCYYNEPEELDSSSTRLLKQKKISSFIEPLQRGRRLVRKSIISDVLGSESEEECRPVHVPHRHDDTTDLSNTPSGWNPSARLYNDIEDVDEIKDSNVLSFDILASRGAPTSMINASYPPATLKDSSETEPVIKLAKSTDFYNGASTSALDASHQIATPKESSATEPVTRLAESTDLSNGASASLLYASPDLLATPKDYSEAEHVTRLSKSTDLSCVICWTDFSSTRGVLPCGHRFCFPCIQNWADHMSSSRKVSTCPLCKASFDNITKVDDAVSSDQKIYSQTIPHDPSVNIYVLPMHESPLTNPLSAAPVCGRCCFREPEDMLIRCHLCHIRCVHSYCLDPYMLPWTCSHCKDLRMLYHH